MSTISLFVHCTPDNTDLGELSSGFSLNQWVDSSFQNEGIDSIQSQVRKTITFNDQKPETQNLSDYNIYTDIKDIKELDFSSLRWADSYRVTKTDSSDAHLVEYTTKNSKAPVRYFKGKYNSKGDLESMYIEKERTSFVSKQKYTFQWQRNSGYTIRNQSQLLFRSPSVFEMNVKY